MGWWAWQSRSVAQDRFDWSPNLRSSLIVLINNKGVPRGVRAAHPHFSDVKPPVETLAVEIELKRAAKSVIERIVNLRDSL